MAKDAEKTQRVHVENTLQHLQIQRAEDRIAADQVAHGVNVHLVDVVLTFEGDRAHAFRLLRAAKNRFGSTNEIGIFEMTGGGLRDVANPSRLFLGDGRTVAGSVVTASLEGTRPFLVEVQALTARTSAASPRRACSGTDNGSISRPRLTTDCQVSCSQASIQPCGGSSYNRILFSDSAYHR